MRDHRANSCNIRARLNFLVSTSLKETHTQGINFHNLKFLAMSHPAVLGIFRLDPYKKFHIPHQTQRK